jgi:hypothetical protein
MLCCCCRCSNGIFDIEALPVPTRSAHASEAQARGRAVDHRAPEGPDDEHGLIQRSRLVEPRGEPARRVPLATRAVSDQSSKLEGLADVQRAGFAGFLGPGVRSLAVRPIDRGQLQRQGFAP